LPPGRIGQDHEFGHDAIEWCIATPLGDPHGLVAIGRGIDIKAEVDAVACLGLAADTIALVLGNEELGLAAPTIAACALRVTLPASGPVESLNVSVAAAVLLHALSAGAERGLS
jgi:hypothetical protein